MKTREPVFDVMKGIGIILMLIGHVPPRYPIYHFIYSFHMPLFFVLAGVFAKPFQGGKSEFVALLKKDANRLVVPVIITQLLIIVLSPLHYMIDKDFHYVVEQSLSLFWNGDWIKTRWGGFSSQLWFLLALFWARTLFRGVECVCLKKSKWHDEATLVICVLLSFCTFVTHYRYGVKMPWEIQRGLTALQFYAIGWYLSHHKQSVLFYVVTVMVWLFALRYGGIDMYSYQYDCYPLDLVGAIGAIWLVYELSRGICKYVPNSCKLLQWFGINSLLIFCIHCLDRSSYLVKAIRYVLGIHVTGIYSVCIHYAITLLMVVVVLYVPFLKRVYGAKQWKEI